MYNREFYELPSEIVTGFMIKFIVPSAYIKIEKKKHQKIKDYSQFVIKKSDVLIGA